MRIIVRVHNITYPRVTAWIQNDLSIVIDDDLIIHLHVKRIKNDLKKKRIVVIFLYSSINTYSTDNFLN